MGPALQRLRRLAGVEPGEAALVGWAAATLFLLEWASVAVSNVSDTLFLKRVGIEWLPLVFLVNSMLLTGTTLLAGRYAAAVDHRRALAGTFTALAALLAAMWALVSAGAPGMATTLVLASKQIDVVALLMFWTVVSALMTSRQGKRLVALMTAGGTVGTIFGAFATGPLGAAVGIPALLLLSAAMFLGAAAASRPLLAAAPARLAHAALAEAPSPRAPLGALWRSSALLRALVASSFLAGLLGPMLYFEFSTAADLATRTADGEQKLLGLYGMLRGWINVGVLAVQVGASAALFRRIGVPLAAALAPAAYVAGFAGLAVRFGLPTAMPASMGTSVLDHTVYEPAQRILGALLPPGIRKAANSLVQGPAKRAGATVGSLLTLLLVAAGAPGLVAVVALPMALAWLVVALGVWRRYPALVLEAASVRSPGDDDEEGFVLDAATLATLRLNLAGPDDGLREAAASLFLEAPPAAALDALAAAAADAPATGRRILVDAIARVLADAASTAPAAPGLAASLLRALAASPAFDADDRALFLHALGRASSPGPAPAAVAACIEAGVRDEAPAVRVAARLAALRCGLGDAAAAGPGSNADGPEADGRDPAGVASAVALLAPAAASPDAGARRAVVAELRACLLVEEDASRADALALLLAGLLADEDAATRRGAATALACVARRDPAVAARHGEALRQLASDADATTRAAALSALGHSRDALHAPLLAARVSSPHPEEAAAARAALLDLGALATDALLHQLRHGGRRARAAVPGILAEIRPDRSVLGAMVDRELAAARELQVWVGALDAAAPSSLLVQRLRERVDEGLHVALEMLAYCRDEPRIAGVARCLGRAWNLRDRAVLLEALEALLPAADAARVLPLVEGGPPQRVAADAARALGRRWPSTEEALASVLAGGDALTVALAAETLDPALVARAAPGLDLETCRRRIFDVARDAPEARATACEPVAVTAAATGVADSAMPRALPTAPTTTPASTSASASASASAPTSTEVPMLSPAEKMLHLRNLDLFEGLTTHQLSELARVVSEADVRGGEVIVREGDYDDRMYFVVSGRVRIEKGASVVARIGPRDFFGEMSVFDGGLRSATAIAEEDGKLLRLDRGDLFEVMEDQPAIGIGISQTLVRRIRGLLDERPGREPSQGG